MRKMVWCAGVLAVALAAVMALSGCSRKDGAEAMEANVESPAPALTPQEACEKAMGDMIQAFKEADLPAAFALLPASRQQDIREFAAAFAQAVPEPLWTEVEATAKELLDTLRAQMPNLLGLAQDSMGDLQEMTDGMIDNPTALVNETGLLQLGDALAEVLSVSRQDMLDGKVEKLIESKAIGGFLQMLMREQENLAKCLPVSFELAEAADDSEVASVDAGKPVFTLKTFIGDGSTDEDIVVCVDGKWIIKELNDDIHDGLQEAIREMRNDPISEADAAEVVAGLRKIREALPMIKAAGSPELLGMALFGTFMSLVGEID